MKRSSYRDRDYAFGQAMVTLRTSIGLTQIGLAEFLHVSRRAVGEWEAGSSYPKVEHIKELIALAIRQRAFPEGREAETVRELWRISKQKVLLDEYWLAGLLTGQSGVNAPFAQAVPKKQQTNGERKSSNNLPFQPTPFIGRGEELAEISRLVNDPTCRLLTLLGPGGIGKTRLAIQVASHQTTLFKDGVRFVGLASVPTPNQIVSAIGEALTLSFAGQSDPTAHLLNYLGDRHILLLLDNFEHLVEGIDLIQNILQHAPYVTMLITSRVRLNLQAEWLFDVEGLSYPLHNSPGLTNLTEYTAIKLFIERATRVQLGLETSESTLITIMRICQQVAGMPLAIELAAAGLRNLTVIEVEQQIQTNLDALSTTMHDMPARHRSMRAVFDHSWNLLSEMEHMLLSRLAVFRGSCTADAAEQVTGSEIEALMTLVNKSLLRQVNVPNKGAEPRFFLLEPIREYALEKLAVRGELEAQARVHATYYLALAAAATEEWQVQGVDAALEQIDHELDNIRAALQWANESDVTLGLQLAGTLMRFWRSRVYLTEGRMWLTNLLALDEHNLESAAIHARLRALNAAAWLAVDLYDFANASLLFEQGNELRHAVGETDDDTSMLANEGLQARASGQYRQAATLLEDMLARHRALGDRGTLSTGGMGFSLYALSLVLREQGNFARATMLLEECIELHRAINDREGVMQGMLGLSDVARDQGDAAAVRKYAEQSLAVFREIGTQWAIGFSLNNLAMAAYLEGNLSQASDLVNESLALFRSHNTDGSVAEVLVTLGNILRAQGDLTGANEAFSESLRLALVTGPQLVVVANLEGLASVMIQRGQAQFAVQFLAAASVLRARMGTPLRPADQSSVEETWAIARQALGPDRLAAIWSQTEKQSLEQVLSESPFSELQPLSGNSQTSKLPERSTPSPTSLPIEESGTPEFAPIRLPVATTGDQKVDWGDALVVPNFYGREWELSLLTEWIIEERCQVVSVLGMGGIGKSALAVTMMHRVAEHFEVVIWRSLRDLPTCVALLEELLQTLAPETFRDLNASFDRRMGILLDQMRSMRVLIVLDNLETVLEEGDGRGLMRPGYEGFGQFLRLSASTKHRSCVLLTSREKPGDLVALEGSKSLVRVLRLARLDIEACEQLLAEKDVRGSAAERTQLIEAYTGNPLALKIVAQTIVDLFDGEIAPFLEQGEVIFGGVRELLSEQFMRLSALEQSVLLWLAIMREPLTFDELGRVLVTPIPRGRVLEAVESLRRRSLIERGVQPGSFTLQSVVLEYVTSRLVTEVGDEIQQGNFSRLIEFGLELAQTPEYVRQTQQRVIVASILEHLQSGYPQKNAVEDRLRMLLADLATWIDDEQGYGPANLLALLRLHRGDLRGVDLSRLTLRSVYLQGVAMQDALLAGATIKDSVFTETFDALTAVAVSSTDVYWAASSRRGEVRIWEAKGLSLHRVWRAHTDIVCALRFSPDGRTLATTGSWDGTVKLWDVTSGALLWSAKHPSQAYGVAFAPDGRMIASTGYDATVRVWDSRHGTLLHTLMHPDPVCGVTWSPDGQLLVTGDLKGHIRLWKMIKTESAISIQTLEGHTNCAESLAFAPDGRILASASWDGTVKLWDIATGQAFRTLTGHTNRVTCITWSPDGRMLASSGRDQTVWLWDVERGSYWAALHGHSAGVYGLDFTSDSQNLLSGSEDGTLRVWDVRNAQCVRVMQGYASSLYDVDWSPDGQSLVSAGSDATVTIFDVKAKATPRVLTGHMGFAIGVGWSADGQWIASSEWNNAIRLWDPVSGACVRVIQHPDEAGDYFDSLMWSPDGQRLASGTYTHGIQLFEINTQRQQKDWERFQTWIRHVTWSPDGTQVAGGGADGAFYVWDAEAGTLLQRIAGHHSSVICVAWSPEGNLLASGSNGRESGELFVWDTHSGECSRTLVGHPGIVYAVAWGADESLLVSGGGDGMIRWWDVQSGECVRVHEAHQGTVHALRRSPDGRILASCGGDGAIMLWDLETGEHLQTLRRDRPYERLDITGIRGLTDAQKMTLRTLGAIENV